MESKKKVANRNRILIHIFLGWGGGVLNAFQDDFTINDIPTYLTNTSDTLFTKQTSPESASKDPALWEGQSKMQLEVQAFSVSIIGLNG